MTLDVTTRAGYIIAAALRGPDDSSTAADNLKQITTAYLRHLLGVTRDGAYVFSHGSIICIAAAFTPSDWRYTKDAVRMHRNHFVYHFFSALYELSLLRPDLADEITKHRDWLAANGIIE